MRTRGKKLLDSTHYFKWLSPNNLPAWTGAPGKTLWEWIELLAVLALPILLYFGGTEFTLQQNQINARNAENQQQEAILATYQSDISNFYLNDLLSSHSGTAVREAANFRTKNILRRLDSTRKGLLLQFLNDLRLIMRPIGPITVPPNSPIINLDGDDLTGAILDNAVLDWVDLNGARLDLAHLSHVNFKQAALSRVSLQGADLQYANLEGANLGDADLAGANLLGADCFICYHDPSTDFTGATMPAGEKHP